jgi:hypothetical protein
MASFTEILVQSPDEAITPHSAASLFDFNIISEYIIPKKELCNRLINICAPTGYRVLGYPVHIPGQKYERNFLIYNLAFSPQSQQYHCFTMSWSTFSKISTVKYCECMSPISEP